MIKEKSNKHRIAALLSVIELNTTSVKLFEKIDLEQIKCLMYLLLPKGERRNDLSIVSWDIFPK